MPKITLLGAGSGFTQTLFTDVLHIDGFDSGVIGLVDVDKKRLDVNVKLMNRVLELMGKTKWRVEASTDRKKVLKGSDYVISTIEVSGLKCVRHDNDIPLKYGIDQCIGDTIGPGGIMKALRTLPPFLQILDDVARLCPKALIMNYTNPMSIMTLAGLRAADMPIIGLCHSVQGTLNNIAEYLDVPKEEITWRCAGITHMAWYTELKRQGKDLYPRLEERARVKEIYEKDPVRFELMRHLGAFVTESSGHNSEYFPWFRKRDELIDRHCREGYLGGRGFYAKTWPKWREETDARIQKMLEGEEEIVLDRSEEYASYIIEAHLTGKPFRVHGNVLNLGLIDNLPFGGCVEVPVLVDKTGFNPCHFGPLPEQLAAPNRAHMAFHELVVQAILEGDREAALHALMLDPLTAAVCSLDEIRAMFDEMVEAERAFIRVF